MEEYQETLHKVEQDDDTLKMLLINSVEGFDLNRLGRAIATNTHLKSLNVNLHDTTLDVTDTGFYDGLKQNSSISNLRIYCRGRGGNNPIGDVGREILTAYEENCNLTNLDIDGALLEFRNPNEANVNQHGGMNVIISTLRSCVDLKSLNLRCCGITDERREWSLT